MKETTIQLTHKRLKLYELIALVMIASGLVGVFLIESVLPVAVLVAGAVLLAVTRIRIWWHHA